MHRPRCRAVCGCGLLGRLFSRPHICLQQLVSSQHRHKEFKYLKKKATKHDTAKVKASICVTANI